jgi:hypothetical protein
MAQKNMTAGQIGSENEGRRPKQGILQQLGRRIRSKRQGKGFAGILRLAPE